MRALGFGLGSLVLMWSAAACGDAMVLSELDEHAHGEGEAEAAHASSEGGIDSLGRPLGAVSAAVVNANEGSDTEATLVTRVEVRPNELLEFYEPEPGMLLLSFAGAPRGDSLAASTELAWDAANLEANWAAVVGDAPIPEALRAAVERADAVQAAKRAMLEGELSTLGEAQLEHPAELAASERAGDAIEIDQVMAGGKEGGGAELLHFDPNGSFCENGYYTVPLKGYRNAKGVDTPGGDCGAGFNPTVCLDHATGNRANSYPNTAYGRTTVCPFQGALTLQFRVNTALSEVSVPNNSVRGFTFRGGDLCHWNDSCGATESRVVDGTGDRYNFRYQVISG